MSFKELNHSLLRNAIANLSKWLPNGQVRSGEYLALNPTRDDKNLGSFRINIRTGQWADFATGDKGGDLISLYAYIRGLSQGNAYKELR